MTGGRTQAYIGLGSNLDDPRDQVSRAFAELGRINQSALLRRSSLYRSDPLGPAGQPDYINAVACLGTALSPLALLDAMQAIEQRHRRVRKQRWGPRTLDLDLLLYADECIQQPRLLVPHPEMHRRAFVLYPLAEIAPRELQVPGHGQLTGLLQGCTDRGLEKLDTAE